MKTLKIEGLTIPVRKNQVVMYKTYNRKWDGEWRGPRDSIEKRIEDRLAAETGSNNIAATWIKPINDDWYLVVIRVVAGSIKQRVYWEEGFDLVDEIKLS